VDKENSREVNPQEKKEHNSNKEHTRNRTSPIPSQHEQQKDKREERKDPNRLIRQ